MQPRPTAPTSGPLIPSLRVFIATQPTASTYIGYPRLLRLCILAFVTACGGHHYGTPASKDPHKLYVELAISGRHDDALRAGVERGLAHVAYAVPVDSAGDVQLEVEVPSLETAGSETLCQVKILVMRAPQHDLLGIADGSARARGTHDQAADDCVASLATNLVRGKVQQVLHQQLAGKR